MGCGTTQAYRAGCRCAACRAANAERHRSLRASRKGRVESSAFKHGAHAYTNWGCRCDICKKAYALQSAPAQRRYYTKNREKVDARAREYLAQNPEKARAYTREYRARYPEVGRSGSARRRSATQSETLPKAHRRGYQWTGPELELAAREDLTDVQVALMIGRTAYAVQNIRKLIRTDPRKNNLAGIQRAGTS